MAGLKIGFYDNEFGLRGTTLATYRYAKYNELVLGNESYVFAAHGRDMTTKPKFDATFPGRVMLTGLDIYFYDIDNLGLDFMYITKFGNNEGLLLGKTPCLIHTVFCVNEPHGHKYAYISDWLAGHMGYSPREEHAVPYITEALPYTNKNLRVELGIPDDATVFGCYAGATEFNVGATHHAMDTIVSERDDIYFILMNIQNGFNGNWHNHPQIKFLPGNSDLDYKAQFVNTCDAMIHARSGGETFGLAVSEFSMANKPVITYATSGEASHLEILGDKGIYYSTYEEVLDIFRNLPKYITRDDWNAYRWFTPENIMDRFNTVFLR